MKQSVMAGLICLICCLLPGCASQHTAPAPGVEEVSAKASAEPAPQPEAGAAPRYREVSDEFHKSIETILEYSASLEERAVSQPAGINPGPKKTIRPKHIRPASAKTLKPHVRQMKSCSGPKTLYRQALDLYYKKNYEQSREAFENFLRLYTDHNLSDNAYYWIGECYYAQRQYEEATRAFQCVLTRFNTSNKFPDSFLKMGLCYRQLRDNEKSKEYWERLIRRYPDSHAAKLARQYLASQPL